MSTVQEIEFEPAPFESARDDKRPGEMRPHARRGLSPQRGRGTGGDLVLPVDGRTETETALGHSIKLAKTYGARVVLMYVTGEAVVPKGYAEYARVEGIRDYGPRYLSSLGDGTIARLRRRVEEEGVECTGYAFVGSLGEAVRACQGDARVLMVVLALPRKSLLAKLGLGGFRLSSMSGLSVPVVLVPA